MGGVRVFRAGTGGKRPLAFDFTGVVVDLTLSESIEQLLDTFLFKRN